MSRSLFYHALGLYGYHHLRMRIKEGVVYLYMGRTKKRCFYCKSYKVIQRGYCLRKICGDSGNYLPEARLRGSSMTGSIKLSAPG